MGQGLRRPRRRSSAIQQAIEQLETRVLLADVFGDYFVAPASAAPGSTIDVDYRLTNGGPEDTPSFHVNFYLSSNGVISGTDLLLSGADLAVAGNTNSGVLTKSLTLPGAGDPFWQTLTNQTYVIGMVVDTDNTVAETNENNNANRGQGLDRDQLVLPPTMDVFGDFFDAPAAAGPGANIGVTYQIRNSGTGATPDFHVNWYLSSDSTISGADILLSGIDTGVAANTSTGHQAKSLTLPGPSDPFWQGLTNQTYHIGMIVDTNNTVDESNETNNSNRGQALDLKSLVMPPMELVGSFFDAPASAAPGKTIDVTYQISNTGAGPTPVFHVEWYVSANNTISISDGLLGSADLNLAGNASTGHLTKSVTLPVGSDSFWNGVVNGTYYIGMIIDTNNTVSETDENNNKNHGDALDRDSLLIDGTVPTVTLFPITSPTAGASSGFFVTYADNVSLKYSTIGNGDIRVTGPNGYNESATLVSASPVGDSTSVTANYTILAPDGGWDSTDNGTYTVSMVGGEVSDTSNSSVVAGAIGTFNVSIAANPPTIGSLTDSPDPITRPADLTLTANNVTAPASPILKVEFYRDSNNNGILDVGADSLFGTDNDSAGGWSATGPTLGFPLSINRYFARAQNNDGFWSNVASTTGTVNNAKPAIISLSGPTDPITRGQNITLTANTVTDADGTVAKVDFYRDSNGNGTLEVGTDVLLGTGTNSAGTNSNGDWSWTGSSAAFAVGANKFFARAADNDGTFSDAVNTTATFSNAAPTIGSLAGDPSPVARGTSLTLTANSVIDVDGTVVKVEFYRDINKDGLLNLGTTDPNVPPDILLGTDTSLTDGWTLTRSTATFPLGVNKYIARAIDNLDLSSVLAPATVTVENAHPTIDSLSVAPDPTARATKIILTANAVSDPDGVVNQVEFYWDKDDDGVLDLPTADPNVPADVLLGADLSPGNGWNWNAPTADFALDTNRFFARAQDNEAAWSATATIVVVNALPAIGSLSATPNPLARGKDITLTANNVTDADGVVANVEFYWDKDNDGVLDLPTGNPDDPHDELLGFDANSAGGWTLIKSGTSLPALPLDVNRFFARAQDNKGAWSTTATITATVEDAPPVIGSLSAAPTLLTPGQNLTLTANNVSDDETVAKVDFYRDSNKNGTLDIATDTLLGSDEDSSDGWSWTGTTTGFESGVNRYFARATDNKDALSAAVSTTSLIAQPCSVIGKVFNDLNGNRRKDRGEAFFSRWRVYVDDNNNGRFDAGIEQSAVTDTRGRWTLHPAQFGTRRIRIVLKRGWKFTAPRHGVLVMSLNNPDCTPSQLFGVKRI